ncbi:MAG: hypothetical protein Q9166_003320 [cf. Caloplaca sp. 2 TL-2023]
MGSTKQKDSDDTAQEQEPTTWDQDFVLTTIRAYLASNLDPKETASALTTPINQHLDSLFLRSTNSSPNNENPHENDNWTPNLDPTIKSIDHSTSVPWSYDFPNETDIWTSILTLARSVPHSSPTIPHLVSLLAAIKTMPDSPAARVPQKWSQLPNLGTEIRENWNRTIQETEDDASWSCTPSGWASMNAFVAQFTAAGVANYNRYAIWALRDALEDPVGHESSVGYPCNLDRHVPAAAVWILYAGKVMYTEWLGLEEPQDRGGSLWEGKGFEAGRWGFWKERFRWVGKQREVEIQDETREMARRAVERMEEIERVEVPRR